MSRLLERLRRSRVLGELSFLLGGAAAGAGAGALLVLVVPPAPVPEFPSAPAWFAAFLIVARGVFVGWWGGLAWSIVLVVVARRFQPPVPVAALLPATILAATALLGVATVGVLAGASSWTATGAGGLAAVFAAAFTLTRGAARADW